MGGFIVLEDGRAYAANNWAFRELVKVIVEALPETEDGKRLVAWLQNDHEVTIYNTVDVRELAPKFRAMFLEATQRAFQLQTGKEIIESEDAEAWVSWLSRFADLIKMMECIRRGESPAELNPHMNDVIPPTGEKRGPGW